MVQVIKTQNIITRPIPSIITVQGHWKQFRSTVKPLNKGRIEGNINSAVLSFSEEQCGVHIAPRFILYV